MILKPETSKESKPSPNLKRVEVSCLCSARNPVCQIPGQKIITNFFFFFLLYALHHYLISKHTFSSKGHIIVEYWNTPWTSTHPPPPTHLLEKTLRCGGPDI